MPSAWDSSTTQNKVFGVTAALAIGSLLLSLFTNAAFAQDWPNRTVKIIAPVGPGGYTDIVARFTADRLSRRFGVPFIVENRAGGGGQIGTEYAVRSSPDGYTLWFGGGIQISTAPLVKKLPYDPITGLTPVSLVATNDLGLAISSTLTPNSLAEFVAYARARPGEINYGISGIGQSTHLAPALWASREKLDLVMVPYPAVPAAMIGLLSGQVQMYFGNMIDLIEPAKARKVKLLAVAGEKRMTEFSDTPTVTESLPGFVFTSWVGYFAPAGTPSQIVEKLSSALSAICGEEEAIRFATRMGVECVGSTPAYLAATIQKDLHVAKAAVEAAGLPAK